MVRFIAILGPVLLTVGSAFAANDPAGMEFFEAKVRPILANHCYKCHSADAAKAGKLKGELLLDTREGMMKGGENGVVLVPGKPAQSKLIAAVKYTNDDLKMPPKDRLSSESVEVLEKWVQMGAPDPREAVAAAPVHPSTKRTIDLDAGRKQWAFTPLVKTTPPQVKNTTRALTAIDHYILAKLEEKKVSPNPIASRTVLIRRAYMDLIGLPPTPTEVDAFVNDPAPDAWPKLIDKLLASDRYGERWGRHWLDIVRFAESNGYEFDGDRRGAYQYRDFVIRAFNNDMPYNQFIRWQIAGDKLMPGNYDAGAATGFIVSGPSPGQITAKTAEPLRYDQLDDMISTLGSSMLGVTIGCARCHDHKYDPFPQRDYYRLIACFADTDATELKLDPHPEIYQHAETKWKAEHAPLVAAWDKYTREQLGSRVAEWTREGFAAETAPWLTLDIDSGKAVMSSAVARKTRGTDTDSLKKLDDGVVLFKDGGGRATSFTLAASTNVTKIIALRIEALADKSLPKKGPGLSATGDFLLTNIDVRMTPSNGKGKPVDVKLKAVRASSQAKGKELPLALRKERNKGWGAAKVGVDAAAWFEFEKPVGFDSGTEISITLKFDTGAPFARTRVAIATEASKGQLGLTADAIPQARTEMAILLEQSTDKVTDKNREEIARWMRTIDMPTTLAYSPVSKHLDIEPVEAFENVFAAGNKPGRPVYYLGRGEPGKKNGLAAPGFIEVLESAPQGDERWMVKGEETASASAKPAGKPTTRPVEPRVAMAEWITDIDAGAGNLLARNIVNRLWLHHMGRGIVGSPNDFGIMGEAPTHPELLDYLARELINNGWHLKPLQKQIMTSSVYMQTCDTPETSLAVDPENKLWWRRPSERIEAEMVRDSLLAVSGALDTKMYGPGSLDETTFRRSVYLTVKRSKPVLLMQLFDAPEAIQSIGQRQVTTVATQALTLMNSPFVRARAEQLAKRVRPSTGIDIHTAIQQAYRLALCRPPTALEEIRMSDFIDRQAKTYAKNGVDTAFADFCQVLLCSDEFVYID